MKRRQTIDQGKDNVILYTVVILLALLTVLGLLYKIKEGMMIKEWEKQVEEPNTAEDYASDEESKFIEDSWDKFIFTGRIDMWPKRMYCFECTAKGYPSSYYYETEELLPIRMEVGDLVKITGEISWGGASDEGCDWEEPVIESIDSIKLVNEEVYIASIPEINRVDKDYILHPIRRPYDYIYYYYEDTGEIIAYFANFISIDETMNIDKKDLADVSEYFFIKRDGKIYKYEHAIPLIKDGKEELYYYNGDILSEKKKDRILKRQRDEDVFFAYIRDPDIMNGEE